MSRIVLITGGEKSGKSRHALSLAGCRAKKAFIATAEAVDEEMTRRIARHRESRDTSFHTVEEPADLAGALRSLPPGTEIAVVDCLTVWLGNLVHLHGTGKGRYPEVTGFLELLKSPPCDLVIVTNEVGMGIIPENEMARHFRDLSGELNQSVARLADQVILMVSGIPVTVKGNRKGGETG